MPHDALVTPLAYSLPQAIDHRTQDRWQRQAKEIPCTVTAINGEMVTVKFEIKSKFTLPQLTIPQAFSQWGREPTQVGDRGYALPADYYMGGQSQLGNGTANTYPRGNLTALVFHPNSQVAFPKNPTRDLNAHFINGPNGVVLQDTNGDCVFTLTPTGIVVKIGGMTHTISSAGLDVESGDIVNNHLTVGSTHVHGEVTSGGDVTGPPSP